jgi:S1-C subfamily serine protease
LRDLGQDGAAKLITLPSDHACAELPAGVADAVFLIPPQPAPLPPPRLGIAMQAGAEGVVIAQVMPDSLAQTAGLMEGDVILEAAGSQVTRMEDVRAHVGRQPPGTWLPLRVRRGTQTLEIVVKFPPTPAAAPAAKP